MKRFLYWLPALLWMSVIFIVSAQPKIALPDFNAFDFAIKKTAHFLEYALLAVLMWWGLKADAPFKLKHFLGAWLLTVLYALSDEAHQLFVPAREGRLLDVLIDTAGATTSLSLLWAGLRVRAALIPTPTE